MFKPLPLYIFRKKKSTFNGISEYKQQVGRKARNKLTFCQNEHKRTNTFFFLMKHTWNYASWKNLVI